MAKKDKSNPFKEATKARIVRTEAYAEKVRMMFNATVNEILTLNRTMPKISDGVMYSFDGDSKKMQAKVELLLRRLASAATMAIQQGISLEWEQANIECDKLVKSVFGKEILSSPEFYAWRDRNNAARDAFINRSEKGLNLSDRVWKSVRQLRDEMEVAITISIGEGNDAHSVSKQVRQYLNDPDLMFRRFRYKKGEKDIIDPDTGEVIGKEPIYGKKWKKRVKGEDGRYHFIDYDKAAYQDEWTGKGYYKSSAQNAMRVARTETNIAYRRADNARWQGMDFVLGQHISVSRNHPKKDICDKLEGDYPKDAIFDGWHPQCFCVVTPILMDESEMAKVTEAFLKGETYTPKGKMITEYPDNFKDWVREHKEQIIGARQRGTEPYFIRNNAQAIDDILEPKAKKKTALEIAQERHAARTPEQEQAIRLKARRRASAMRSAETYIKDFKDFEGVDTSALENAYKHARWDDVRSEALKLAQKKRSIIENSIDAMKEAKDFGEIDTTKLKSFLDAGKLAQMQSEAQNVANLIAQTKAAENAISDLIPNAHELHQSYTMGELEKAHKELDGVMKKWLSKYSYSSIDNAPLQHLKNKLDFELTNPTYSYSNQELIKKAIIEKIKIIDKQIEWNDLVTKGQSLKTFVTKSPIYKAVLTKIDAAILSNDANALRNAINEAEVKRQELIEKQIKRGGDTKTALNKEYKGGAIGKDISSSIDVSTMTSEDPYNSSRFTNNIARMQGFDAPAKLVSETEFEMLEKACGEVFYRTVNPTNFKGKKMSSKEFASQLYVADLLELNGPGGRVYGDGMYVATSSWDGRNANPLSDRAKQDAYDSSICYGNGKHTISEMTFTRMPKIIKQTELSRMWNKLTDEQQQKFGDNMNTYGCALGYDAMYCDGPNYMVIWNRSIIAVKNK